MRRRARGTEPVARRAVAHLLRWVLAAELAIVIGHVWNLSDPGTTVPQSGPVQTTYWHTHLTSGRTTP